MGVCNQQKENKIQIWALSDALRIRNKNIYDE